MKIWPILLFSFAVHAEVWEKPEYVPDENHMPEEEIQKEEQEEKSKIKKDQKQEKETFQLIDDEIPEDQEILQ